MFESRINDKSITDLPLTSELEIKQPAEAGCLFVTDQGLACASAAGTGEP